MRARDMREQCARRIGKAVGFAARPRSMNNRVSAAQDFTQQFGIGDVARDVLDSAADLRAQLSEAARMSEADARVLRREMLDECAADESAAAGDHDSHNQWKCNFINGSASSGGV